MELHIAFSDGTVVDVPVTDKAFTAVELFTKVQGQTPADYFKDVIDAAIKTAVGMIDICGGIDTVSGVLDRQGGEKQ